MVDTVVCTCVWNAIVPNTRVPIVSNAAIKWNVFMVDVKTNQKAAQVTSFFYPSEI